MTSPVHTRLLTSKPRKTLTHKELRLKPLRNALLSLKSKLKQKHRSWKTFGKTSLAARASSAMKAGLKKLLRLLRKKQTGCADKQWSLWKKKKMLLNVKPLKTRYLKRTLTRWAICFLKLKLSPAPTPRLNSRRLLMTPSPSLMMSLTRRLKLVCCKLFRLLKRRKKCSLEANQAKNKKRQQRLAQWVRLKASLYVPASCLRLNWQSYLSLPLKLKRLKTFILEKPIKAE